MAQTNTGKLEGTVNENGEIVYQAPVEFRDRADLDNYGITWDDCRTLYFGKSDKVTVYYLPTTNRHFAEEQWKYLNTEHSRGYRSTRCMVPGKRKALIVCSDSNKCSSCPYDCTTEDRQARTISWEGLIETGYGEPIDDRNLTARLVWMEFEQIKKVMDAKNPLIARVIILKEMQGYEVTEIAEMLGITERKVYYYLQQAKAIGKRYKQAQKYI